MRYAFEDRLISVVGAADTLVEFEAFITDTDSTLVDPKSIGVKSAELAALMDMLTEDRLQGFKKAPVTVEFATAADRDAFYARFNIVSLKRNAVIDKHEDMLAAEIEDPYSEGAKDDRTIEEMYDLHNEDRWDKRTGAEKMEDAQQARQLSQAQKNGDITLDSFEGPNPNRVKKKEGEGDNLAAVQHIAAHENADGSISIDSVMAIKNDDDAAKPPSKLEADLQQAFAVAGADALADDDSLGINPNGMIAIYHKVEATGAKLAEVLPVLTAAGIDLNKTAAVQRNTTSGCWFAFERQLQAEQAAELLIKEASQFSKFFSVETYAVNDAGERLVPKGVAVVTEVDSGNENPRPWNFRAPELLTMLTFQKDENKKTIMTNEFVFCGAYEGPEHGTIVYITPRVYFKEHGKMWDAPLDIGNLLPGDLTEIQPGIYRTKRDWNNVSFDLNSRGFKENLMLQIAINNT